MYASSRDAQATVLRDTRLHDGGRARRRCCAPGLTRSARVSPYDHDPAQQTGSRRRACGAFGSVERHDSAATGLRGSHSAGRAAGAGTAIVGARAAGAGTATVRRSGVADAAGETVPRSRCSTGPEGRAECVRRDRAAAGVERNQESPGRTSEPAEWRERTKQCTKQRGRDRQRSGSSRWVLLLRPVARVVSCSAPEGCGPAPVHCLPASPTGCTLRMYTCVSRSRSSKPGGNWDA
jgi:hypothetical protein